MIRINIKRGLDIPLSIKPGSLDEVTPSRVALLGCDFTGLRVRLAVEPGDRVSRGDVLFTDLAHSQIRYVTPASGVVRSIDRGPRHSLESVVVSVEENGPAETGAQWPHISGSLFGSGRGSRQGSCDGERHLSAFLSSRTYK